MSETPRVAVLGPVQVADHSGAPVEVPGVLGKALLVSLVLARGTAVSAQALIDDIWQDEPPRNGRAALQTLVSRVRSIAGEDLIESVGGGYRLTAEAAEVDLWIPDAPRRGEPGADLGGHELGQRLRETADRLRAERLGSRAAAALEMGDAAAAAADARALTAIAPFDEDAQLLLMSALAACGRRNDALRSFAEFRRRLAEDLGTDPGDALIACNLELLRQERAAAAAEAPDSAAPAAAASAGGPDAASAASASAAGRGSLAVGVRAAPNALIGRDRDVAALEELLAHSRLTTVLGAGGLGKTRLAQELANRATRTTPAVVVVELAGVRDPDDVPIALASALGVGETSTGRLRLNDPLVVLDLRTRIVAALGDRTTLIVLDNCEHVIDAAAYLVDEILAAVPSVRVLATSRSPLRITAESVYPLDALSAVVDAGGVAVNGPAVELFLERARAARPAAVLPIEVVIRLCERLEGLPLAIELAAARIRSMSVEEIERRLGNRFALLRGGDRSAPERHRTLLAVIDWSWNLLADGERVMLRRLSRFPDGFSSEAAVAVSGAADPAAELRASDDLDALVLQSLVNVAEAAEGRLRYRMLETVREFGGMSLIDAGEDELVDEAIAGWARAYSLHSLSALESPQQMTALHGLELEYDNLLAALRRAIEHADAPTAFAIFSVLLHYWIMHNQITEATAFVGLMSPLVEALPERPALADGLVDAVSLAISTTMMFAFFGALGVTGDPDRGDPAQHTTPEGRRAALRLAVRMRTRLRALEPTGGRIGAVRAILLAPSPRPASIFRILEELCASEDPYALGFAAVFSAMQAENMGEPERAERLARIAYDTATAAGDSWVAAQAAQNLSQLASQQNHPEESAHWSRISRDGLLAIGAVEEIRQLEWHQAISMAKLGDTAAARVIFERFLVDEDDGSVFDALDVRSIGWAGLAELAALEGDEGERVRLYRRGAAVFENKTRVFAAWNHISVAGAVAASAFAGGADEAETRTLARELRVAVRVNTRMRGGPALADRPVLGTALLGLSAWLIAERAGASEAERAAGVELLALAIALHGRQDQPVFVYGLHEAAAAARCGADALAAAKARAAALTGSEERVRTALDILAAIRI